MKRYSFTFLFLILILIIVATGCVKKHQLTTEREPTNPMENSYSWKAEYDMRRDEITAVMKNFFAENKISFNILASELYNAKEKFVDIVEEDGKVVARGEEYSILVEIDGEIIPKSMPGEIIHDFEFSKDVAKTIFDAFPLDYTISINRRDRYKLPQIATFMIDDDEMRMSFTIIYTTNDVTEILSKPIPLDKNWYLCVEWLE